MRRVSIRPLILVLAFSVAALAGCGGPTRYALTGTSRLPGVQGEVSVESGEGGNALVKIQLEHLAPPNVLDATTYAVWFIADGQGPSRMGNLAYDEDDRTGSLMATTTLTAFTMKVTAESSEAATAPSDVVVTVQNVRTD